MIRLSVVEDPGYLDEVIAAIELDALERLEMVMLQVGQEVKDYLVSLTDDLAPPISKAEGPRQKHPGEWADRSGQLALSYSFEVVRDATSVTLTFRNSSEYAFWVEAMDGFFVLSGVLEPGGPVERAVQMVVERLLPGWRVVLGGLSGFRAEGESGTPNVGGAVIPLEGE